MNHGCMATYLGVYCICNAQSHSHKYNVIFHTRSFNACNCPYYTHNHTNSQSHDEHSLFLDCSFKLGSAVIQGGNVLYWAASCLAVIFKCVFSQSLSQTQTEARCRAWKEDYICTSKCECSRQRRVAKSQSEYKLGLILNVSS